ncbi:MAG: hypothetical protein AAF329_26390 [Cyanobacteria bacterium P01_A01_bin.17]
MLSLFDTELQYGKGGAEAAMKFGLRSQLSPTYSNHQEVFRSGLKYSEVS